MSPDEKPTEFVMSPQRRDDPCGLTFEQLLERATLFTDLAMRLQLYSSQRIRPSDELQERVRMLLQRYADVAGTATLSPGDPLAVYVQARVNVVRASQWLGMKV